MNNKRRFPRLNMPVQIEYAKLENPSPACKGRMKDISIAGISIITNELLEQGTYLDVKFFLPKSKEPIEAISKVAWSREVGRNSFETGIEFVKIKYADQERIGQLIKEP